MGKSEWRLSKSPSVSKGVAGFTSHIPNLEEIKVELRIGVNLAMPLKSERDLESLYSDYPIYLSNLVGPWGLVRFVVAGASGHHTRRTTAVHPPSRRHRR